MSTLADNGAKLGNGEPTYFMASEGESQRLKDQHAVTKSAMPDGELVCAPIDLDKDQLYILDSGTADGTWILDLNAMTGGHHRFVGTDVNTQELPHSHLNNVTFHTQDINQSWPTAYVEAFDLVHQRLTMPFAGPNGKQALSRLANMVKPGGWIQLLEGLLTSPDPAYENPHVHAYLQIVRSIYSSLGAPLTLSIDIPIWLKELGFQNIHTQEVVIRFGAANADRELGQRGALSQKLAAHRMVEVARKLPQPPMAKEQLDSFADDFGDELMKKGMRLPIQVIWAQKKR